MNKPMGEIFPCPLSGLHYWVPRRKESLSDIVMYWSGGGKVTITPPGVRNIN